jgi:hypothetical protein
MEKRVGKSMDGYGQHEAVGNDGETGRKVNFWVSVAT